MKYALSREQVARAAKQGAKTKQHTSGIKQLGWGMEAKFREAQDTLSLLDVLKKVWAKRPVGEEYARPFFVGVTLRELMPESEHQAGLFSDPDNRNQLSATMDKLNLKYGHTTLHFAGMLPARETAPTRIAFTQIPVQYGVRVHVTCVTFALLTTRTEIHRARRVETPCCRQLSLTRGEMAMMAEAMDVGSRGSGEERGAGGSTRERDQEVRRDHGAGRSVAGA